jgi:hypothetical protein
MHSPTQLGSVGFTRVWSSPGTQYIGLFKPRLLNICKDCTMCTVTPWRNPVLRTVTRTPRYNYTCIASMVHFCLDPSTVLIVTGCGSYPVGPIEKQQGTTEMTHLASCTLHHAPCIMRSASCTLHHAPCIMPPASCPLHHAPCIMHPASCALHHAPCITHCQRLGSSGSYRDGSGHLLQQLFR